MKVLIFGSEGQLGRCLRCVFENTEHEVTYCSRDDADVCNASDILTLISSLKPAVVINVSGYTKVDKAEDEPDLAEQLNHFAVENMARACLSSESWFIHLSTNYVFDGIGHKAYSETDHPRPKSIYGKSKLNGELKIFESGCNYLIVRTSWVFSEFGDNFVKKMLNLAQSQKQISLVCDQVACPTYGKDIAKAIISCLPILKQDTSLMGLYHFCGNRPCSWFDFATEIFSIAGDYGLVIPQETRAIPSKNYPTQATRPSSSVLNCSKFHEVFGVHPSNMTTAIHKTLESILGQVDGSLVQHSEE